MSLEAKESKRFKEYRQFDYLKNRRMIYIVEEHLNLEAKLGVAVGFDSSYSINDSDQMLGYESLSLSHVRSIKDEAPRFCHIVCEEESSRDRVCSIKNRHPRHCHTSNEVHRAHLISAIRTIQING